MVEISLAGEHLAEAGTGGDVAHLVEVNGPDGLAPPITASQGAGQAQPDRRRWALGEDRRRPTQWMSRSGRIAC